MHVILAIEKVQTASQRHIVSVMLKKCEKIVLVTCPRIILVVTKVNKECQCSVYPGPSPKLIFRLDNMVL